MWEIYGETEEGATLYAKTDEDGLIRVTAIKGYPELDDYLASLEATEPEAQ
jgi:hypothetical protein